MNVGTVDTEHAAQYDVPADSKVLRYGFVLVNKEETVALRHHNGELAMKRLGRSKGSGTILIKEIARFNSLEVVPCSGSELGTLEEGLYLLRSDILPKGKGANSVIQFVQSGNLPPSQANSSTSKTVFFDISEAGPGQNDLVILALGCGTLTMIFNVMAYANGLAKTNAANHLWREHKTPAPEGEKKSTAQLQSEGALKSNQSTIASVLKLDVNKPTEQNIANNIILRFDEQYFQRMLVESIVTNNQPLSFAENPIL
ncbi:hat family dimerization protein [Fusarium bulbicola]|nr:hat family dimerization protein [Fusarium bulbicola]